MGEMVYNSLATE